MENIRGGWFEAVENKDFNDDGGIFFSTGKNLGWLRVFNSCVQAQWFGVNGADIECGNAFLNAVKYVSHNGGVLKLPSGIINIGTSRVRVLAGAGIKPFEIIGTGPSTIISFKNINPPPSRGDSNWVKEIPLLSFEGNADNFLPEIKLSDFVIDYSDQNNQGGNELSSLQETHPTPYSLGVWAVCFFYSLTPIIENITIRNVYGNGIVIKKSFYPIIRGCKGYNVSGDNIVTLDGKMSQDSDGGFCFIWSCFGGLVENCIAWNTRVYKVDFLSPDNSVQLKNTLCGYIGFWAEYAYDKDGGSPPLIDWISDDKLKNSHTSQGIVFRGNFAYGYTIGIKTENNVESIIDSNIVINCYLPILASGTKAVISSNFVDMLHCSKLKCPQGGLEFKRSCLGGATWLNNKYNDEGLIIENNYVKTSSYPLFLVNRDNLTVRSNFFHVGGDGKLFDSKDNRIVYNAVISDNVFTIDSSAENTISTVTYNDRMSITKNKFVNLSKNVSKFNFLRNGGGKSINVSGNVFDGFFDLLFTLQAKVNKNLFTASSVKHNYIISIESSFSQVIGNDFNFSSSKVFSFILLKGSNLNISSNYFSLNSVDVKSILNFSGYQDANINIELTKIQGNINNSPLMYCRNVTMLTSKKNFSDCKPVLIGDGSKLLAPVFFSENYFGGGLTLRPIDYNSANNLSKLFNPSLGERLHSTNPLSGGFEGIVFTLNGWKGFGRVE